MKNLVLLLVFVSLLFSCKKETIEPIIEEEKKGYLEFKANIFEGVNSELEVNVISDEIGGANFYTWGKDSHKIILNKDFDMDKIKVVYCGKSAIHDVNSIYFYSLNNQLNNTPIEIRIYD